ncbi:unannotated protein [freshwater metagenome]|uniref:Unannotated protein n=1 Tax=freshwater metagenome TaxID=449393 RepID=A0A6J7UPX7_9ZZZZ
MAASQSSRPLRTAGSTTTGLNTARALATTSGWASPMDAVRLIQNDENSGSATLPRIPGLGGNPSAA